MKVLVKYFFVVISILVFSCTAFCAENKNVGDSLYNGFSNPPNAAKPRVWWHWMNGNITKEGIRKDLEWMHRVGIGGLQNFDASMATPRLVSQRLLFMTPEWKDAFGFATKLADSLAFELAIASSPGWSESGGPWVQPKDGMKKIVWSELRVEGGKQFSGLLPDTPFATGDFQNISQSQSTNVQLYSGDIAVIAYRLPDNDLTLNQMNPKITSSGGNFTLDQLTDGNLNNSEILSFDGDKEYAWLQFEFEQPQTIKAITLVGGGIREVWGVPEISEERSIEAGDDGVNFKRIAYIPLSVIPQQTINIQPTTAKFFRVVFKDKQQTKVSELILSPVSRVNRFEEKAGFATEIQIGNYPTLTTTDVTAISDVIDITENVDHNGRLIWTPPTGNWKIIRLGYSLTGKKNGPAIKEATGLEVDKMDADAVKNYFEYYLNQYKDATKGLMGEKGLQYMLTDSYEAGQSNWTPRMIEEFRKRRGYNMIPWIPVLTGAIITSAEVSDKFLWDYRKTIAELITDNHYNQLTSILDEYDMKRYSESHENGRVFIADGMDVKRNAAIPMSAIWVSSTPNVMYQADIRESASVAHIYGQNLVAAESFTVGSAEKEWWRFSPERLKPTADLAMAHGLNRFVIHTSVHQPFDDKIPGLGLGSIGQWFNRHETWAEQANAWTDYLARSSYMLQQGNFVADIVYYYGEDTNITGLFGYHLPDIPEGYNYDFINSHALINLLTVKDGNLVTPSGMSYRILVLDDNARQMPLSVLKKISSLVKNGAVICGVKPEATPSLSDNTDEFDRLVNEIWGTPNKRVFTGIPLNEALTSLNVAPDFEYFKPQADSKLLYVHRKLSDGEIYWVNNRNNRNEVINATFRVTGKVPMIWHPETGEIEPVSYKIEKNCTAVTLNLTPNDAVFVVFQAKVKKTSFTLPATTEKELMSLNNSWAVTFQANRGVPTSATFDQLTDYTKNSDPRIKYFSGTASYSKDINVSTSQLTKDASLWLDLGEVKNLAEVIINDKSLGVLWKTPFRVNVTNVLIPGNNSIVINIINLWPNRLIGDAQPDVTDKLTYTTAPFYKANDPLLPSGLLGPVRIYRVEKKK